MDFGRAKTKTILTFARAMGAMLAICLGTVAAHADDKRFVISIGNNHGLNGEETLRYAEQDAQSFASIMNELGGARADHVFVVKGKHPDDVWRTLSSIRPIVRQQQHAEVIVYYAGHGDLERLHMQGEYLNLAKLKNEVAALSARLQLIIVDSCRSLGAARSRGITTGPSFDITLRRPEAKGAIVITSASAGEPAQESDALRGAVFSHFLFSGLRGAADNNGDGQVTLDESYAFAYSRTLMRTVGDSGAIQRPTYDMQVSGNESVLLTQTRAARSRLIFPKEVGAQYFIYSMPNLSAMAEVSSDPNAPQTIALPAGRFLVQRRVEEHASQIEINLPWGGSHTLRAQDFHRISPSTLIVRGASLEPPDRFSIGAGAMTDIFFSDSRSIAFGGFLGGYWQHGVWLFGLDMRLAEGKLSLGSYSGHEWRLGARPNARYRIQTSPSTSIDMGVGGLIEPTWQSISPPDAARQTQAGFAGSYKYYSTAFGGYGLVAGSLALSAAWSLMLELDATMRFAKDASSGNIQGTFFLSPLLRVSVEL